MLFCFFQSKRVPSLESEAEREKSAQNWFSKRLGDLSKEQKQQSKEMSELAAMAKLAK